MGHVLVVFESRYGQSEKVADRIVELAKQRGHDARRILAHDATAADAERADAAFVVAPIYFAHHPKSIATFVAANATKLSSIPSALFSVSGSAADPDPEAHAALQALDRAFLEETGWAPKDIEWVAGAFSWPRYGFFVRFMMKRIAKTKGAKDIDTSRVDEHTDWVAVDSAIETVLEMLNGPLPERAVTPRQAVV